MKLIIGCGYLGQRVARRWLAAEEPVAALTRSSQRAAEFRQQGILPIIGDVTQPSSLAHLSNVVSQGDTVLYAVGYDRSAGHAMREVYVQGLLAVLDQLPDQLAKVIYISSTGVYGQNHGETINEDSPTEPTREGGQVCLAAEQALLAHRLGQRAVILRMAGIYGPGRVPNRRDLEQQLPIAVDPESYLNLIHVEDGASAVLAAEARASTPSLYLVSDGSPVKRSDYYAEIARLWQTPPPVFQSPNDTSNTALPKRRGSADKLVDSSRLRRDLQPDWQFADYRSGLSQIFTGSTDGKLTP